MARFSLAAAGLIWATPLYAAAVSPSPASGATGSTGASATATTWREQFTLPSWADVGANVIPWVEDPEAKDPQAKCPGYTASAVTETPGANGLAGGFTAELDLAGEACNVYGTDVANLLLTVEHQSADRLHVEIKPRYLGAENSTWFELPEVLIPKPTADAPGQSYGHFSTESGLDIEWTNEPSFGFSITRKATGESLFSTIGKKLIYEDQFIEFASPLPENYNLYGLGEVIHGFRLGNNLTRTIFAADAGDPVDGNIYGSHPIYVDTRYYDAASGKYVANATDTSCRYESRSHAVYLRNAHAQEVLLRPEGITWRALGGTVDLYFYAGPNVADILKSYQTSAIGLPAMQQYFAFGFHQCRWGYDNWTMLQDVIDNFKAANIPLETIWTDIDYMNQYRDFENDQSRFSYEEAVGFFKRLHEGEQHFVPIVDSAIYAPNPENASDAYPIFDRGVEADAFMLNPDGSLYIGAVWPGYTVFPDFIGAVLNGTGAFKWWAEELTTWYRDIPFSGIWIDMSEVSSFCVGSCGSGNLTLNPVHPDFKLPGEPGNLLVDFPEGFNKTNATEAAYWSSLSASQSSANNPPTSTASVSATSTSTSYLRTTPTAGVRNVDYPPYVIDNIQGDLTVHAVSPNATHHGGTQEYDMHNLFGHQILNATYQGLLDVFPGKRPFIIGRSTFAGSGKWAGHWGGDNTSLWAYMVFSISQALSFSIFGIPMFGVDTCGFNGNSDMELCARWMQLSAFFPFYRNHNTLSARPQEPYVWSEVASSSRTAMEIRYSLLPYIYTLFADAHATGSTVMRALSWEFPEEPWLANADHQFLLGPALMVTPCLEQGATTVNGVFPGAGSGPDSTKWYDWYNQTAVGGNWLTAGQNVTLDAPLGHIPLFVRGGHVLAKQGAGMTTAASRRNPWDVLVALDGAGKAAGSLYLDDGESVNPNDTLSVQLRAEHKTLSAVPQGDFVEPNALTSVTVMGVDCAPTAVSFNGQPLASESWAYDAAAQKLQVSQLHECSCSGKGAWNSAWSLTWN